MTRDGIGVNETGELCELWLLEQERFHDALMQRILAQQLIVVGVSASAFVIPECVPVLIVSGIARREWYGAVNEEFQKLI
jgi:hypothetical protein